MWNQTWLIYTFRAFVTSQFAWAANPNTVISQAAFAHLSDSDRWCQWSWRWCCEMQFERFVCTVNISDKVMYSSIYFAGVYVTIQSIIGFVYRARAKCRRHKRPFRWSKFTCEALALWLRCRRTTSQPTGWLLFSSIFTLHSTNFFFDTFFQPHTVSLVSSVFYKPVYYVFNSTVGQSTSARKTTSPKTTPNPPIAAFAHDPLTIPPLATSTTLSATRRALRSVKLCVKPHRFVGVIYVYARVSRCESDSVCVCVCLLCGEALDSVR